MKVGPHDGISALISQERACFLALLSATERYSDKSTTQKKVLTKTDGVGTLISDFQPPQL